VARKHRWLAREAKRLAAGMGDAAARGVRLAGEQKLLDGQLNSLARKGFWLAIEAARAGAEVHQSNNETWRVATALPATRAVNFRTGVRAWA
jgi:hypothetical protein